MTKNATNNQPYRSDMTPIEDDPQPPLPPEPEPIRVGRTPFGWIIR